MVLGQSAATAAVPGHRRRHRRAEGRLRQAQGERLLAGRAGARLRIPPRSAQVAVDARKLGGIVVDDAEAELHGFESMAARRRPCRRRLPARRRCGQGQADRPLPARPPEGRQVRGPHRLHRARQPRDQRAGHHLTPTARRPSRSTSGRSRPLTDSSLARDFRFEKGKTGFVEISNEGTDGHVIIDAVQWLPVK